MSQDGLPCVCCLSPGTVRMRLDKKMRPTTFCAACGARTFFHHQSGLRGIRLLAPMLVEMFQSMVRDGSLATQDAISAEWLASARAEHARAGG